MPALKHIHTYVRMGKNKQFYRCFDPLCSHSINRMLLEGKASLCPECGTQFTLTWELLRRARPLCLNCSSTKEAKQYQGTKKLMEQLIRKEEFNA